MNYDTYIYLFDLYNWYMWLTYSQISVEQTCLKRSEEERETADVPHIAALYSVVILSVVFLQNARNTLDMYTQTSHPLMLWNVSAAATLKREVDHFRL